MDAVQKRKAWVHGRYLGKGYRKEESVYSFLASDFDYRRWLST